MLSVIDTSRRVLTAEYVQRLQPHEQAALKGTLRCPEPACRGDAWFKPTNKKQRAYFSAHHRPGCDEERKQRETITASLPEVDTPHRNVNGVRLVLTGDDRPPAASVDVVHDPNAAPSRGRAYRRRLTDDVVERPQNRHLRAVALDLLRDPQLASTSTPIHLGRDHSTFREFFVHLTRVTDEHVGQLHGYWGRIDTITPGKAPDSHFVNSHGAHAQNVQVRASARAAVLEQNHERALHDGGILVIGTPIKTSRGYRLLPITDAANIAVVPAAALR